MPTAEDLYKNVQKHLSNNINLQKRLLNIFSPQHSLEEMFSTLWSEQEIQDRLLLPDVNININRKGSEESAKFRTEGNRLYKEKKFDKALLGYNYSVLVAPHPQEDFENEGKRDDDLSCLSGKQTETNDFECLALAFANRSALLYEMNEFGASIEDIDRAIKYGFPQEKINKLYERKAKCLLALNEYDKAESKVTELIDNLKSTQDRSNLDYITSLEQILQKCSLKQGPDSPNSKESKEVQTKKYKNLFNRGPEENLFLSKKAKEKLRKDKFVVESSVNVKYSEEKGRYLCAARDIEPGEILMAEKAHCSILKLDKRLRWYCCVCMRRAIIALPCPNCSLVVFCSDSCRSSKHVIHWLECPVLPILITLSFDQEYCLVFRTFCLFTMEGLKQELEPILNKEISEKEKEKKKKSSENKKQYLNVGHNYTSLYHLEGNMEKRTSKCFQETAAHAILIVRLLLRIPEFWCTNGKEKTMPTSENVNILGGQIMRLILNFHCNMHCIKELHIDHEKSIVSSEAYDQGFGIYSAFSLMNHSCFPNSLHSTWGDTKFLYSISFIPKGKEIVDSYGERFASHDLKTRKTNLLEAYYFDCDCIACLRKWPLYGDLPSKFALKCTNCNNQLDMSTFTCSHCKIEYALQPKSNESKKSKKPKKSSPKVYNAAEVEEQLSLAWVDYNTATDELNKYISSYENINKISKLIKLMDMYTYLPNKAYIEAQENLLRCFDLFGSLKHLLPDLD